MDRQEAAHDRIITTREAARLLGIASSTVQYWMDRGMINTWKTPGGRRRTRESHVRALVGKLGTRARLSPPSFDDPDYMPDLALGFPVSADEAARLAALARLGLMISGAQERFHRIVRLATALTDAPVALVSLMAARRQWIKAGLGWDGRGLPRARGFCTLTILGDAPLVVEDAVLNNRYRRSPLILGGARIRFYAGFALRDRDGLALGTLGVMDHSPAACRLPCWPAWATWQQSRPRNSTGRPADGRT